MIRAFNDFGFESLNPVGTGRTKSFELAIRERIAALPGGPNDSRRAVDVLVAATDEEQSGALQHRAEHLGRDAAEHPA